MRIRTAFLAGAVGIIGLASVQWVPAGWARQREGASTKTTAAPSLHMAPRVHAQAVYEFEGRVEIQNRDATFVAPPAYRESFAFWTERLKGAGKRELIRILTVTREADDEGKVPFQRKVPRFQVEISQGGQWMTSRSTIPEDVRSLVWDGALDRLGNVTVMNRVEGDESGSVEHLSFPLLDYLFPRLDGPRDIDVGTGFTDAVSIPLPSRLNIDGLEDIRAVLTREYVLEKIDSAVARFKVSASYALDPDTPPQAPDTTCVIGGSGAGHAVFDVKDGVFLEGQLISKMTFDVEAPLRPLPDQKEGEADGKASTHLAISVKLNGKQKVAGILGSGSD